MWLRFGRFAGHGRGSTSLSLKNYQPSRTYGGHVVLLKMTLYRGCCISFILFSFPTSSRIFQHSRLHFFARKKFGPYPQCQKKGPYHHRSTVFCGFYLVGSRRWRWARAVWPRRNLKTALVGPQHTPPLLCCPVLEFLGKSEPFTRIGLTQNRLEGCGTSGQFQDDAEWSKRWRLGSSVEGIWSQPTAGADLWGLRSSFAFHTDFSTWGRKSRVAARRRMIAATFAPHDFYDWHFFPSWGPRSLPSQNQTTGWSLW